MPRAAPQRVEGCEICCAGLPRVALDGARCARCRHAAAAASPRAVGAADRRCRACDRGDTPAELALEDGERRRRSRSGAARRDVPADRRSPAIIACASPTARSRSRSRRRAASRCDDIAPARRLWGLAVQLYSLRRAGDGGIGDTGAVRDLAEAAARAGADALALSPTHSLFAADPAHFGPYSPSSRLFLNPLLRRSAACSAPRRRRRAVGGGRDERR